MWLLTAADSDDPPLTFRVRPGVSRTIGRGSAADFIVAASMVSRLHCRVTATEEALEVEDLQSTNGTFVNEARQARARLVSGDRLRLGRLVLVVKRSDTAPVQSDRID